MEDSPRKSRAVRLRRSLRLDILVYAANIVMSVLFLMPLLWALGLSVLPKEYLFKYPPVLFHWPPTLATYREVLTFDNGRFLGYAKTSAEVACATAVCVATLSSLAGYSFARLRFAGRNLLFMLVLATMMFPFVSVLIPLYIIMSQLRLVNNPLVLVILYSVGQIPFCTFLLRNSFEAIPEALHDAALIDGCSELDVFRRVMLPLAVPAIATVVIYSVYQAWNEFTCALIFLTSDTTSTVPVGLATFSRTTRFGVRHEFLMTGSVLSFIPVMLVFFVFQRYFVRGLTAGATKG